MVKRIGVAVLAVLALLLAQIAPAAAAGEVMVTGRVVDPAGKAIGSAGVRLLCQEGSAWVATEWIYTDDGSYSFGISPGATCTVSASVEGRYDARFLGSTKSVSDGNTLTFTTATYAGGKLPNLVLVERGTISGTVRKAAKPVVGEHVTIYRWRGVEGHEPWGRAAFSTTDAKGAYRILLSEGVYTVQFGSESFFGGGTSLPEAPDKTNSVAVVDGVGSTADLDLPSAANVVTGMVVGPDGPLVGANVQLSRRTSDGYDERWEPIEPIEQTGVDGRYSFELKQEGTYRISGWENDHASRSLDGTIHLDPNGTMTYSERDSFDGKLPTLVLPKLGALGGRVRVGTEPAAGQYLEFYLWGASEYGGWGRVATARTGDDGTYREHLYRDGTYTIRFAKHYYLGGGSTQPASPSEHNSVEVVQGKITTVNFTINAPKVTVPTIGRSAKVGSKVTAKLGSWKSVYTVSYQWLRNDVTIKGATKSFYTVAPSDAGKKLSVRVTATKPGMKTQKATSKTVKVSKATPSVKVSAKPGSKGKAKLSATVILPGTKASAVTAKVKVYDGKKLVKTVTLKKGKATVSLSKLKKGSHTFKVSYGETKAYKAKSASVKVKIK